MTNAITISSAGASITPQGGERFDELTRLTLQTIAGSSARVYGQTFAAWRAWASDAGVDPLMLTPAAVLAFLGAQDSTKATRQRQLSALRKLAAMLLVLTGDDDARRMHEALKLIRVPRPAADVQAARERTGKALTPAQADRVLRAWASDEPRDLRNRALIAVLALAGVRRAEAVALRWRDIDFDNGVITIAHGKGDKRREAPLSGDYALDALRAWHMAQPEGYTYVFTPVLKSGKVGADKPIAGTDVYRVVKETEALAGVEFKPHDMRRTFITEALDTGTPLATVQAAVGHERGETTLRYAKSIDARRARRDLKLRYG